MTERRLNPNSPFFHEQRHADLAAVRDAAITVCGAGALGGNLAETLARMGIRRLRIVDRNRVEQRNLSTQPYTRAEIGAPKARCLANALYRSVEARAEPIVSELTEQNAADILAGSSVVVDCFDNRAARAAVSLAVRALGLPCLHVGFSPDGLYGSGVWEPWYIVPADATGDPCDYPLTRPFALVLAALAARAVVERLLDGPETNFEITWHDLVVTTVRSAG